MITLRKASLSRWTALAGFRKSSSGPFDPVPVREQFRQDTGRELQ